MPRPTDMHIDTFLSNAAAGYTNASYIAKMVLPVIKVVKETGKIAAYGNDHYRIDSITPRAFSGRAPRVDWSTGTPITFSAKEWTLEHPVDDRLFDYCDDPFQPLVDGTFVVQEKLALKLEDMVATMMNTATNFLGAAAQNGSDWTTFSTGTPVKDLRIAVASIMAKTGMSPTNIYAVMSWVTFNNAIQCAEVKNFNLNTTAGAAAPGLITPKMLATYVGIQDIYVGSAVKLTSAEGVTDAFASVWTDHQCAVYAKSPRPSLQSPSFASIIAIDRFGGIETAFDRYREEQISSTVVRGRTMYDQIAINQNYGVFINSLNA